MLYVMCMCIVRMCMMSLHLGFTNKEEPAFWELSDRNPAHDECLGGQQRLAGPAGPGDLDADQSFGARWAFSCTALPRTRSRASAQSAGVSWPSSANVLGAARW